MEEDKEIKKNIEEKLKKTSALHEVDALWREYLGRKGKVTIELRNIKDLPEEDRKKRGKELNQLKVELGKIFDARVSELKQQEEEKKLKGEWLDVTRPAPQKPKGSLHPLTKTLNEVEGIFNSMGFSSVSGPQIESEKYNFDYLNIPPNHPARDLWDTLWMKMSENEKERLLLRTHTSPMQVRYMEKNNPPFRIIVPGRVFRYEATDASHEIQFYQLEGLMVDEHISVANFRAIINEFFNRFFSQNIKTRLRPSYFPFVEPGFEVDISCVACDAEGCSVCSRTGWLEMMGAGMVHPHVFESAGHNPKNLQGFAFGVGVDRLAMMKYNIDDIRLFYSSDLRFLNQ